MLKKGVDSINKYWELAIEILMENGYDLSIDFLDSDASILWSAVKCIDTKNKVYDKLVASDALSLLGLMGIIDDWKLEQKIDDYFMKIIRKQETKND